MKASTRADLCLIALIGLAFLYDFQGNYTVANTFLAAGYIVIALGPEGSC